jgi:hypothetical protein
MSAQATLDAFELRPDRYVGEWRLATDEPGYHGLRRYWRTDEYVLVANQSTNSFSVYDVETWETGILGQGNEPVTDRNDCEDAFEAALAWMAEHRDSDLDGRADR